MKLNNNTLKWKKKFKILFEKIKIDWKILPPFEREENFLFRLFRRAQTVEYDQIKFDFDIFIVARW